MESLPESTINAHYSAIF